ncbi:DUF1800 domain-containing protein [Flavilitoribacter nigricans]|uniref:DUF1800 domain-containing protein n=1 Tax=Flavilitoribacter nigricans (strain ATCC 23147 / DSM 23189 / NBRC 102662 / NCIMB 1420 / SS-2) TaxID=1122177 RepID=A0A2D0NE19_FLAN2|nr:DUF1800 domain-containing protein [Flavilitoribacter nigricans]PHN06764.1 hypothetical protein CRP01_10760 [Flavilitoribacter nigricans DSM 23189 = NBRC 102662]
MQQIKHLYWRAGFGLSPTAWAERRNWSVQRAVEQLFAEAAKDQSIRNAIAAASGPFENFSEMSQMSKDERRKEARKKITADTADWIQMMADERSSALKHRMMLFWHGHFACRVLQPNLALKQLAVLEEHALGNFRDLVLGIARDPAMIRYLNNQQNRKDSPNENFARELMELFTIGRGNYSERDVKEAARAFTGWSSNLRGEFVFRRFQHDFGSKTFMGKTGNFDGDDIIDMLLARKQTAVFLTRKIYRYFVNDKVDEARVQELAESFYSSGYDIGRLMRNLFSSDWFYAPQNMGTQIKSPIVLLVGMMRTLPTEFRDDRTFLILQKALGQMIFNPPNVAGWPGGQSWIDNSTLMLRLNLPVYLLEAGEANLRPKDALESDSRGGRLRKLDARIDFSRLENWLGAQQPAAAAKELAEYLIVRPVQLPALLAEGLARQSDTARTLPMMLVGVMSLPEYQLC